jgi:hypothetical protein
MKHVISQPGKIYVSSTLGGRRDIPWDDKLILLTQGTDNVAW